MNGSWLFAPLDRWLAQGEARRRTIEQWLIHEDHRLVLRGKAQKNGVNNVIFLLTILVLGIDWVASSLLHFPLAFFLPIGLMTWWNGRWQGVLLTGILMLAYSGYTLPSIRESGGWFLANLVNGLAIMIVFLFFVYLIDQVVRIYSTLVDLVIFPPVSETTVKSLRGILPICSFCKRIRNEANAWEQLEEYITRHSAAEFSHSICPSCREQYYGNARKA